jgi:hypothetical protein
MILKIDYVAKVLPIWQRNSDEITTLGLQSGFVPCEWQKRRQSVHITATKWQRFSNL